MNKRTGPFPDGIDERAAGAPSRRQRIGGMVAVVVFGSVVALGLTGALGHERTWQSRGPGGVELSVHMPETIRNGEFLEIRIGVESNEAIDALTVGVGQALWEDLTVNTLLPAATEESSIDGEFRFTFGPMPGGASFLFKVDAQINPDILGGNAATITVYDGDTALASVPVEMRVLP